MAEIWSRKNHLDFGFDGDLTREGVRKLDEEVDGAYPQRWIGKVTVTTRDGKVYSGRVDEPKGDPGNTLSREEIEDKSLRLGTYLGAATESQVTGLIKNVWAIASKATVGRLLPA